VEHAVLLRDPHHLAAVPAVGQAVPVGDHRALGKGGRARCVEDGERVVRAEGGAGLGQGAVETRLVRIVEDVREPEAAWMGILGVHDHPPEMREVRRIKLPGVGIAQGGEDFLQGVEEVDRTQVVGEEEGGRVRLAEDIAELLGLVARVERRHDGADHAAGVLGDKPGRPVGQPEGDLVILPDAEGQERPGEAPRLAVKVGVGDPPVGGHDGLAPGEAPGEVGEHGAHGGVEVGIGHHRAWYHPPIEGFVSST
jgi:hypothetical protein